MPSPEPRFSKIAAGIGDPTRARMLAVLMDGQALAAGELAAAAGVGASTASAHIARLLDERAGRGEFEALGLPLPAASTADMRSAPTRTRRFAHACFDWSERRDHLAGSLAAGLLDHSLARGWLRRIEGSRALQITPPGAQALGRWIGPQASAEGQPSSQRS